MDENYFKERLIRIRNAIGEIVENDSEGCETDNLSDYLIQQGMKIADEKKLRIMIRTDTFGETELDFENGTIYTCPFYSKTKSGQAAARPRSTHGLEIFTI